LAYTVTDSHGCVGSDTIQVTVGVNPTVRVEEVTVPEENLPATMSADTSGSPCTVVDYYWSGPDGFIADTQAVSVMRPGMYTVTVGCANGCSASDSGVLTVLRVNQPPVAEDQFLTTFKNVPLRLLLRATDPDIDLANPNFHRLTFSIYGVPIAGAMVSGSLDRVTYSPPQAASVEVVYTPALNFVGLDTFTFLVEDPFGSYAIGTIRVVVKESEEEGGKKTETLLSPVVINEIAWAGTAASSQDEWIELTNNTNQPVDLTGWTLRWRANQFSATRETEWKGIRLVGAVSPHGYYLLERSCDDVISDIKADLLYDTEAPYHLDLSDSGEVMELLDPEGCVVDTADSDHLEKVGWTVGSGTEASLPFATMERVDPLTPDWGANWTRNHGIIFNGVDRGGGLLEGTPAHENESTRLRVLEGQTPQTVVQKGERIVATVAVTSEMSKFPELPRVILVRKEGVFDTGELIFNPLVRSDAVSGRYVEGLPNYEVTIETSQLESGIYQLWIGMGKGIFHHLLFQIIDE
jgi:hypothetical protein